MTGGQNPGGKGGGGGWGITKAHYNVGSALKLKFKFLKFLLVRKSEDRRSGRNNAPFWVLLGVLGADTGRPPITATTLTHSL